MKTLVDARLTQEAARFSLRFACEDCVHFDAERTPTCGQGWPVRVRREEIPLASPHPPAPSPMKGEGEERPVVSFCKEFELA